MTADEFLIIHSHGTLGKFLAPANDFLLPDCLLYIVLQIKQIDGIVALAQVGQHALPQLHLLPGINIPPCYENPVAQFHMDGNPIVTVIMKLPVPVPDSQNALQGFCVPVAVRRTDLFKLFFVLPGKGRHHLAE